MADDQTRFTAFLEERKKVVTSVSQVRRAGPGLLPRRDYNDPHATQHATKCERWYDTKRNDRREELQDARSLRKDAYAESILLSTAGKHSVVGLLNA